MASLDFQTRQLAIKLVYYGPALSGKTTNLRWIYAHVDRKNRGRLMTLDTRDDRTVFFDLLPIFFETAGLSFRIKVFTVPGQPMHEITRRVVLKDVDGVAFVADSRHSQQPANRQSYQDLRKNLVSLDLTRIPIVIQYNKQDLVDIASQIELSTFDPETSTTCVTASAIRGVGVFETFFHLLGRTWEAVDRRMQVEQRFGIHRDEFIAAVRQHVRGDEPATAAEPVRTAAAPAARAATGSGPIAVSLAEVSSAGKDSGE